MVRPRSDKQQVFWWTFWMYYLACSIRAVYPLIHCPIYSKYLSESLILYQFCLFLTYLWVPEHQDYNRHTTFITPSCQIMIWRCIWGHRLTWSRSWWFLRRSSWLYKRIQANRFQAIQRCIPPNFTQSALINIHDLIFIRVSDRHC